MQNHPTARNWTYRGPNREQYPTDGGLPSSRRRYEPPLQDTLFVSLEHFLQPSR